MEQIVINDKEVVVMNLVHYFVTEKNYNPVVVHGINDEIWLENMDYEYKLVRIVSRYIHNNEQLNYNRFRSKQIARKLKLKTFSLKMNMLSIYTDIGDNVSTLEEDNNNNLSVFVKNITDIGKNKSILEVFPDIVEKTQHDEKGIELLFKITDDINGTNEEKNKKMEKIFSSKRPIVTYGLILICIIMFILSGMGYDAYKLVKYGANFSGLVKNGEVYRLVSYMFLHAGILHIGLNMYSLYIIGREVENLFGKIKYIIIFILSGIFGSIMSLAFTHNTISAGASGAIFGLLGALLYFGMHYRTYLGEAIKRSIIPIIVVNLIIGFFAEGIDLAAHIGGLVGGVLVAMMVGVPDKSKTKDIINGTILTIIYLIFISYLAFWR